MITLFCLCCVCRLPDRRQTPSDEDEDDDDGEATALMPDGLGMMDVPNGQASVSTAITSEVSCFFGAHP